jgi:hypothetical protein
MNGQAGNEGCSAGCVGFIEALDTVTQNDIIEKIGAQVIGTPDSFLHDVSRQFGGSHLFQGSAKFADGSSHR